MEPTKIYQALREKITKLELRPESVLNLSELAGWFKVSRTPVKEALILLQAEGLVVRQGVRFIVTPLSLDRIKEITEIRFLMEVQANIWAMNRINSQELTALGRLKSEILNIGDVFDNKRMIELDLKFHRLLFEATKNSQLAQLLERMLSHYFRFWLNIPRQIEPHSFFSETLRIIRAIEKKDETKLKMATVAHIRESVNEILGAP